MKGNLKNKNINIDHSFKDFDEAVTLELRNKWWNGQLAVLLQY